MRAEAVQPFAALFGVGPHCGRSAVEPEVLETRAVVDAVDHCRQPFDVWFAADCCTRIKQDRTGVVFDQFALDIPDNFFALLRIGLGRLAVDQLVDLGIAIAGVVARRAALIIFIKCHIRIVDAVSVTFTATL